ncbi:unnamed protein product, partial [Allacma fusca]
MRRIKTRASGEIAAELISIMACLNPRKLNIGLVNAIYSETACESKDEDEVQNSNMTAGLELLIDNFLVKKEGLRSLKIHKLVQQCGRKAHNFQHAMNKICSFFELNEANYDWRGHIRKLIDTLEPETSIDNKNYKLCLLLWRYCDIGDHLGEILQKCKPCFKVAESLETFLFQLLEICYRKREDRVL